MRRGRMLSLCLVLALCLSLLPATALAAVPEGQIIYVGNESVTNGGYWTTDSNGNVTAYTGGDTPTDNYIHYDVANNTLTLHNATIKESVSTNTSTFIAGAAIGVLNQNGDAELTITLEGTNTIAEVGKGIYVLANSTGGATLTITGDGSLDASARQTGIWVQSNSGNATLTIRNAKVEATGTSTAGYGVNVQSSNSSTAALTVDGGSLTASGSPGILYDSSGSGTVPNTTTLTIRKSAIVDAREGGIGAGYTVNLSGVSPTDGSVGIVFGLDLSDSKAGTVYGNVTLQDNLEISEGESLTIPDGASLTIGNDATLTVDGGELTGENIPTEGVVYKVTGVTLSETTLTLEVGGTETLTATITPSTATNQNVMWTSDNEAVATVDNGVVSAVGSGTATITVKTEDGAKTASCTVSVTPYIPPVPSYLIQLPEVEGGTVTADRAAARQGTEVTLTVTPDEGFALASLTVTDFFGNQVDISRNSDGTYSFVMPASQVTVSAVFAPAQLPFTDVTEANWYYDEVYYVWANGLMQGTSATTFGPGVDTTRAMVVTILWRLEGEPASGYDMDYSDVAGGAWYADAVRWATEHGIVNGSEGQFYPGGIVTREQLAAMLYRYAQYKGYDLTAGGDLSGFADAGAVSGWAETSLAWAVGQGLLQGSDSQVDPQGSAIRAQTAAILMRFCENTAN